MGEIIFILLKFLGEFKKKKKKCWWLTFSYLSSTASVLPVSSTGSTVCLLNKREEKKKTICLEIDRYLFKKIRESLWWWLAPFYIYLRHLHNKRRRNKTNGRFKVPNKVYCKKKNTTTFASFLFWYCGESRYQSAIKRIQSIWFWYEFIFKFKEEKRNEECRY
jgi:hypothetical protein